MAQITYQDQIDKTDKKKKEKRIFTRVIFFGFSLLLKLNSLDKTKHEGVVTAPAGLPLWAVKLTL